ncbi:MAG: RNA polymerase sigma factor [Clostridia bacterium]|nr:RNA polymerase sigma factor [Clostridia bacterium]
MKGVIKTPAVNYYRTDNSIECIVEEYANMLFRVSFVILGNSYDAEDAVQETFIRYMKKAPAFESREHEKAWLIRVATNQSRDILRFRSRNNTLDVDTLREYAVLENDGIIIQALFELPEKLKTVLYLHYVEGYKVCEIAKIISRTPSAVKMRLKKGREELKKKYLEEVLYEKQY